MDTVLLASLGSPGDINPFIALGLALKEVGATPLFLANPHDIPSIERHGIGTIPVGEPWDLMSLVAGDPKYVLSPQAGLHTTRDVFIPYSRRLYPAAAKAIEAHRPAAVVSHAFCFGSTWAARSAGIPAVVAHLAPISLMSKEVFAVYPFFRRLLFALAVPLGKKQFGRLARPLCTELGIPWDDRIIERTMTEPDLLLGLWSRLFADLPSFSSGSGRVACGFPAPALAEPALDVALEEFLTTGDPPVAVTLGTNAFAFAGSFFDHALAACRKLGLRALVVSKKGALGLDLADDAFVAGWADYGLLFPRCRAIVHHGGAGVTSQALGAGVPSVVVPFGHDQEDNGMRVERLGAGRLVPRSKTGRRLSAALSEILAPAAVERAARVGEALRQEEDGAAFAAGFLSKWLAKRP